MSIDIPIIITGLETAPEQPSKTYMLNWEKGRILPAGSCDGLDAVNQFVKKALLTPRFRCLIYDNQYGSEIKRLISDDVTQKYIETEMHRIVKDALSVDGRILEVYDFSFSFETENAYIKFKMNTVFGQVTVEEVI